MSSDYGTMESSRSLSQFHRVILIQGTISLLVFTIATCAVLLFLRNQIREQILQRDGVLLTDMAQHFHKRISESESEFVMIDVALESSEIRNVIGVGLYSSDGENMASIPADMYYSSLPATRMKRLESNEPVTTYFPEMRMDSLFTDVDALLITDTYPVTEILSPIVDATGQLSAVIQFWLDAGEVAHELNHLDQYLAVLGAVFIVGGGCVFVVVFYVSRNRLLRMGRLLAEQNQSLRKANADLAMAARTSAIGSISSHLFHGLKNPLAGLKAYLQLTGQDDEVLEITTRMQNLIDESLAVIQDGGDYPDIDLSMEELVRLVGDKLVAGDSRIRLLHSGTGSQPAHKVQLLLLVMQNLLDNALEAAPGATVLIEVAREPGRLSIAIEDNGPGLPAHVREHLFDPVRSTKENGTGIGLAISSVIARHVPATLQLRKSDSSGTTFLIEVPL